MVERLHGRSLAGFDAEVSSCISKLLYNNSSIVVSTDIKSGSVGINKL